MFWFFYLPFVNTKQQRIMPITTNSTINITQLIWTCNGGTNENINTHLLQIFTIVFSFSSLSSFACCCQFGGKLYDMLLSLCVEHVFVAYLTMMTMMFIADDSDMTIFKTFSAFFLLFWLYDDNKTVFNILKLD